MHNHARPHGITDRVVRQTDQEQSDHNGLGESREPPLVLNFFPASFSAQDASVWVGRWEGEDGARQLLDSIPGLRTWRDPTDGTRLMAWHPTRLLQDGVPGCR